MLQVELDAAVLEAATREMGLPAVDPRVLKYMRTLSPKPCAYSNTLTPLLLIPLLQVELDAAVLEAATREMGLPAERPNLRLHCADSAAWMAATARAVAARTEPPLDLVLLDAFDGDDAVPACFTQPGSAAQPYPTLGHSATLGVQAPTGRQL